MLVIEVGWFQRTRYQAAHRSVEHAERDDGGGQGQTDLDQAVRRSMPPWPAEVIQPGFGPLDDTSRLPSGPARHTLPAGLTSDRHPAAVRPRTCAAMPRLITHPASGPT